MTRNGSPMGRDSEGNGEEDNDTTCTFFETGRQEDNNAGRQEDNSDRSTDRPQAPAIHDHNAVSMEVGEEYQEDQSLSYAVGDATSRSVACLPVLAEQQITGSDHTEYFAAPRGEHQVPAMKHPRGETDWGFALSTPSGGDTQHTKPAAIPKSAREGGHKPVNQQAKSQLPTLAPAPAMGFVDHTTTTRAQVSWPDTPSLKQPPPPETSMSAWVEDSPYSSIDETSDDHDKRLGEDRLNDSQKRPRWMSENEHLQFGAANDSILAENEAFLLSDEDGVEGEAWTEHEADHDEPGGSHTEDESRTEYNTLTEEATNVEASVESSERREPESSNLLAPACGLLGAAHEPQSMPEARAATLPHGKEEYSLPETGPPSQMADFANQLRLQRALLASMTRHVWPNNITIARPGTLEPIQTLVQSNFTGTFLSSLRGPHPRAQADQIQQGIPQRMPLLPQRPPPPVQEQIQMPPQNPRLVPPPLFERTPRVPQWINFFLEQEPPRQTGGDGRLPSASNEAHFALIESRRQQQQQIQSQSPPQPQQGAKHHRREVSEERQGDDDDDDGANGER